eukprot:COSAG01_NODE_40398_length_464_cov_0.843836_1_plen_86_part_10
MAAVVKRKRRPLKLTQTLNRTQPLCAPSIPPDRPQAAGAGAGRRVVPAAQGSAHSSSNPHEGCCMRAVAAQQQACEAVQQQQRAPE